MRAEIRLQVKVKQTAIGKLITKALPYLVCTRLIREGMAIGFVQGTYRVKIGNGKWNKLFPVRRS